jgi:hypothetical protein
MYSKSYLEFEVYAERVLRDLGVSLQLRERDGGAQQRVAFPR